MEGGLTFIFVLLFTVREGGGPFASGVQTVRET
jgi:hypothetical protein